MPTPPLTPFAFQPILRRYVWGGRRLGTLLGKPIGGETDYAESWEIVDRGADQSIVQSGPYRGQTLQQLLQTRGRDLLGRHAPLPRFPLLFKFLDAHQKLSVQVHPDDAGAARLLPPDLGKTEAWVILHADPGSILYAGLKRGFDRAAFERELRRGTAPLCLHTIEPKAGDCLFIPAGVVHALGAGLVVAELQQSSDVTFRLFDWNRTGADGRPRALHWEQGLAALDDRHESITVQTPQPTGHPGMERLVACDKFLLDRWRWQGSQPLGGDDRCHLLAVLSGEVELDGDPGEQPLTAGSVRLIPASVATTLHALQPAVMLEMTLPD